MDFGRQVTRAGDHAAPLGERIPVAAATGAQLGPGRLLDALEEIDRLVIVADQVARVIESPRGTLNVPAPEVREVVALGHAERRGVAEIDRTAAVPNFAQLAPVVGGVANGLVAGLVAAADLGGSEERVLGEIVFEIAFHRPLVALAVLGVVHRRAPELEARIGEVLCFGSTVERLARPAPSIAQELRLVQSDDRRVAGNVQLGIGEERAEHAHVEVFFVRRGILSVELDPQVIGEFMLELQAVVGVRDLIANLTPGERVLRTADRHEAAAVGAAPAIAGIDDIARLEQAVLVVNVVRERPHPALRTRRGFVIGVDHAIAVDDVRTVRVLLAPDRISLVIGQVGRRLIGALAPRVDRMRANELRRDVRPRVGAFPLERSAEAVALAVVFLCAELSANRRHARNVIIGEPVTAGRAENRHAIHRAQRIRPGERHGVGRSRQRIATDLAIGRVRSAGVLAVAILVVGHLQAVRTALDLGKGAAHEQPERAGTVFPGVADQPGKRRSPFFAHVAVVGLDAEGHVHPVVVERLARVEVHRTGEAALDHVGGRVLADDDRPEQLRRHVGEVQRLAANAGGKRGAAVEFRTHEGQAAHLHARTLDREVVGVVRPGEAVDRHAGQALQRFRH